MNESASSPHVHCVLQLRGADWQQGSGAGWMSSHLCEEVHAATVLPTALGASLSL